MRVPPMVGFIFLLARDLVDVKQHTDERKWKLPVAYAYVEIDRRTFEYESDTTKGIHLLSRTEQVVGNFEHSSA